MKNIKESKKKKERNMRKNSYESIQTKISADF